MERTSREESLPAIKRIFDFFDVNHDGLIDDQDMRVVLKSMQLFPAPTVVKAMIAAVDSKRDGVIDFDEFTQMRRANSSAELNVIAQFKRFDIDTLHRGYLTAAGIRKVLSAEGWATEEAASMCEKIMAADSDGDGLVSFRDMHSLMTRRVPLEWAEWVWENLQRGVDRAKILDILVENGFARDRAQRLVDETARDGHAVAARSYADSSFSYVYTLRS